MTTTAGIILGLIGLGFIVEKLINRERDAHWENVESRYPHAAVEDNSAVEDKSQEQMKREEYPDTAGLMFNTLHALGCQPTKNDDGSLLVSYQGENFHMEFNGMYARVWDPAWALVMPNDPNLPKIREVVNATNFNFGPTVVLTAPDDGGIIRVHSRLDIMLHPLCPDNVPFVKSVLESFFDTKEELRRRYMEIHARQMEAQNNRRPVGFTANMNTDNTEQE